jgi:hypothetical protein
MARSSEPPAPAAAKQVEVQIPLMVEKQMA